MKLCVIGGAGARSAFLTKSLVKSARDIRVDHIVLLDNDQQKLKTYGEISRELSRRLDPDLTFEVTSDARAALTGVDYIITTIRAGEDAGRLFDEQTCLAHGVLGQETTGAGGFAMAIRSVPTLVYYCTLAREVANPGHLIFNFTNPSGIITQALRSKGFDNVYGRPQRLHQAAGGDSGDPLRHAGYRVLRPEPPVLVPQCQSQRPGRAAGAAGQSPDL